MNRTELLQLHSDICALAKATMEKKNADYAQGDDPFMNLKLVDHMGLVSTERGILVRLADKFQRLANLIDKPPAVADETFDDTIVDGINYLILCLAVRMQRIQCNDNKKATPIKDVANNFLDPGSPHVYEVPPYRPSSLR